MFSFSRYLMCLLLVLGACSPGDKDVGPKTEFQFELYKMEELGRIDSAIMISALDNHDENVVAMAARACGITRDNRFVNGLARLCAHQDKKVRKNAIFALGEIGDSSSVRPLSEVLHSEDMEDRLLAIEAFGKIGDRRSASFIKPFLRKSDEEVLEAVLALWRMADTSSLADLRLLAAESSGQALYGAIYAMFRLFPDSCVPEFINVFAGQNYDDSSYAEITAIAARGLGSSGDTAAVLEIFDRYSENLSRPAKIELIRSLGRSEFGRERLEKILDDNDDNGVKRVILLSLGQIGDPKSRKIIEKYLEDNSLQVRLATISVLPEINKKSPTNTLVKYKSSNLWQMRAAVARALGKVKSNRSLRQLRLMLEDKDDRVKAGVIEGLGEFPIRRNIDIIKAALNGSDDTVVKSTAAEVLGKSKNNAALDILLETAQRNISTSDIDFARSLISSLGYFVDTTEAGYRASEMVKKFLDHPNRIVRQDAFSGLGELAPEFYDPGTFDVDFNEEDYNYLQSLRNLGVIAIIEIPHGIIKVKLAPESAPRTCVNFVKLAERGFFDNLSFHRVVQNFVVQGGCPRGDGWGGPGYTIREEINPIKFKKGAIGMATSGRDTGGSQFFICLSDQPHLDGRYTAFGNVIEGWEILDNIEIGDKIISVKIEKGRLKNESRGI
jgi:cyclophilin family peptidyl-prolyl cis-trans isomerase/HEAT repeat protein